MCFTVIDDSLSLSFLVHPEFFLRTVVTAAWYDGTDSDAFTILITLLFFFLKCSETPRTITQSIRLHQTATPPHLKPAAGLWLALGCYLKLLREEELANRSHATANVEAVWHLACTTVGCLPMEVWRNRVTVCNGFLRYKGGHTSGLLIYVVCLHSPMLWSSDITIMHSFIYGHFEIIRSADKPRSLGVNIIVYNLLNSTFFYLIKLVYISFAMIELYYVYTAGNEIAF